ncbi:hypothetical protein SRABI26_01307 [Arthrobacter sp. Bi26]|nr:hypothetical protein SRABI26_01307 [Arthrobacter sp. Bi26]
MMADLGPEAGGEALQRRQRGVRVQLAAVRHVQHARLEPDAPPALGGFLGGEELRPEPGGKQRIPDLGQPRIGAVVHDAGARQQPRAGVRFQLAPQPCRLGQHGHVVAIRVAGVEVPGCAVGSPVAVAGPELLQQGHVPAAPGQRPRGGGAHRSAADDHGVQSCLQGFLLRGVVPARPDRSGQTGQASSRATPIMAGTATTVVINTVSLATVTPVR